MAKYQEKRDPLYVDILPATREHIAIMAKPVVDAEDEQEMYIIGELMMPDGLAPVWNNDVIVDYGETATPRYVRMPAADVSAFFERPSKKPSSTPPAPQLPAASTADKLPSAESGEK